MMLDGRAAFTSGAFPITFLSGCFFQVPFDVHVVIV
jgi:hypothetical protein